MLSIETKDFTHKSADQRLCSISYNVLSAQFGSFPLIFKVFSRELLTPLLTPQFNLYVTLNHKDKVIPFIKHRASEKKNALLVSS
jgi:hypothetical protein